MKNGLKLALVLLLLVSCKDTNQSKAMESVIDEAIGKNEDINEKYDLLLEELGTKTPLTDEQLLQAYPKKLGKLNFDSKEPRITPSETLLGTFGDKTIRMEILDGGGANAVAAILPLKMLLINKVTSENNNTIRYSKKERNGILTFGTDYDKNGQGDYQSDLRFLYDNRFYVTLEGEGMNTDELWDAIKLDDFKRFKELNN